MTTKKEERLDMIDMDEFIFQYRAQILSKCQLDDKTSCLIWHGPLSNGMYGKVSYTYHVKDEDGCLKSLKHYTSAPRLIYATANNSIYLLNKEYRHVEISHLCHNRLCCNIEHLEAETKSINSSRTKCKNKGHCSEDHDSPCILFN